MNFIRLLNKTHKFDAILKRQFALKPQQNNGKNETLHYVIALGVFLTGIGYAAVPMYSIFCKTTGYTGAVNTTHDSGKVEKLKPFKNREITVQFNADLSAKLLWNFKPQQQEIKVYPGETALAFYTAKNNTSRPVVGISTYNVLPYEAAVYFVKIQCFCFEEQLLNPGEQVDMPVFFYIDPDYVYDVRLMDENTVKLSYTFFESKPNFQLPIPDFLNPSKNVQLKQS